MLALKTEGPYNMDGEQPVMKLGTQPHNCKELEVSLEEGTTLQLRTQPG